MSSSRNTLRLPLVAASVVLMSMLTACSDLTAPTSNARSGYITTSTAQQATSTTSGVVPAPTPAPTPAPLPAPKKAPTLNAPSGYNVPA